LGALCSYLDSKREDASLDSNQAEQQKGAQLGIRRKSLGFFGLRVELDRLGHKNYTQGHK